MTAYRLSFGPISSVGGLNDLTKFSQVIWYRSGHQPTPSSITSIAANKTSNHSVPRFCFQNFPLRESSDSTERLGNPHRNLHTPYRFACPCHVKKYLLVFDFSNFKVKFTCPIFFLLVSWDRHYPEGLYTMELVLLYMCVAVWKYACRLLVHISLVCVATQAKL